MGVGMGMGMDGIYIQIARTDASRRASSCGFPFSKGRMI